MSSDSEEDFLSADEGSDEESTVVKKHAEDKSRTRKKSADVLDSKKASKILPEPDGFEVGEGVGGSAEQEEHSKICDEVAPDVEKEVGQEIQETSESEDVIMQQGAKEVQDVPREMECKSESTENLNPEKSVSDLMCEELEKEVVKCKVDSDSEETSDVKRIDVIEIVDGASDAKEVLQEEELKLKVERGPVDIETKSSTTTKIEDPEVESKVESKKNTENIEQSKAPRRPIKESRIGMKKPRERLGERLGAKKLGSRIEKKLDSRSYDSLSSSADQSKDLKHGEVSKAAQKLRDTEIEKQKMRDAQIEKQKMRDAEIEEQKMRDAEIERQKRERFLEQERRWQEVHGLAPKEPQGRVKEEGGDGGGWGSWGGWGTSLLSAASTFTKEVTRGVGSVMETVEAGLGVPDPETMAREVAEREKMVKGLEAEKKEVDDNHKEDGDEDGKQVDRTGWGESPTQLASSFTFTGLSSLGSIVTGVSGVLETASNKVLLGGLDTLETIGRKTMDVIQHGDPGLHKKRAFLINKKPNLSLVLQEARQRAEEQEHLSATREGGSKSHQEICFENIWDSTDGPAHAEALALVARQSKSKISPMLQSLPPHIIDKVQEDMTTIKNTCTLEEDNILEDDFIESLKEAVSSVALPIHSNTLVQEILELQETVNLVKEVGLVDGSTTEQKICEGLAKLVTQLVALLHKSAELALTIEDKDARELATQFREVCSLVCSGTDAMSDDVCGAITTSSPASDPDVNTTITNIYLHTGSSNHVVQKALSHMADVLRHVHIKCVLEAL